MWRKKAAFLLAVCLCLGALSGGADPDGDKTARLEARTQAVLDACVAADMSDVETLTALHDWLCLFCEYAPTPESENAYGSVVEGMAVCVGYAAGYAHLAEAAGLAGTATYSEEIDHAWILATLDGTRYFSDTTWDDGKGPCLGRVEHEYFLFNEDNAAERDHTGWDSPEQVPGGGLEAVPWADAVTRVIFRDGWCWYFDRELDLCRCDRESWQAHTLLSLDTVWPVLDQEGYVYVDPYTSLVLLGDRLWFNTPYDICSVALDGTDLRTELTPDTSQALVYGLGVRDGYLCYSLAQTPDDVVFDIVPTDIPAADAWGYVE